MAKYIASGHFQHPLFGEIAVRSLSTAKRLTARWKSHNLLAVTVPRRTSPAYLMKALDELMPRLLKIRPQDSQYYPGWSYRTPEMDFEIHEGKNTDAFEGKVDRKNKKTVLLMPSRLSPDDTEKFSSWVRKIFDRYASKHAASILLPFAWRLAEEYGVKPRTVSISYGRRILGRCNSKGEILLSRNLVFYPEELRRLVIAHEFAHLSHLNHSDAFKNLLNHYTGGRLNELNKALRLHSLPF